MSAGFLEPLEATTLHIILNTINKIIGYLPRKGLDPYIIDFFNRQIDLQLDTIKDFLVLHYHQSAGRNEPFWRHMQALAMPDRIVTATELFRRTTRIEPSQWDQSKSASWFSVLLDQRVAPPYNDPLADNIGDEALTRHLTAEREAIARAGEAMPTHEDNIRADYAAPIPA